jgi:hypothetical protein
MATNQTGSAAPVPLRPRYELADVFRRYGDGYRETHPLPTPMRRVMRAITTCRTAAQGGHLARCTACRFERPAYSSCRNRHCPKCQSLAKARWLEARQQAEGLVRRRAVVAGDPHADRGLARIGPMPREATPASGMAGTRRETCLRPGALGNIGLAGERSLVTQLHRPAHATVAAATGTASLPRRCSSRRRGRFLPHFASGVPLTLRPAIHRFLTGRIRAI